MTQVRLPRVLDSLLRETARLHPTAMRIDMQLAPVSEAEMTLPPGERIGLRQLAELYTPQGSAGVFRVTSVAEDENGLQHVRLVHGLTTLSDVLIPGEGDCVGSVQEVLTFLLSHQETVWWQLGTVETDQALSWHYDATNLMKALVDVMQELPSYHLAFDQSARPWKLHVRRNPTAVACEARLSRNLQSLRIVQDDSELCTRLFVSALETPLEADTIGQWGAVSRWMTVNEELEDELIVQAAEQYLASHKDPQLTVSLDALELCLSTGETLDRFTLGTLCRLALPDRQQTVLQRVVGLSYRDVYGCPEAVRVTLSSRVRDTADAIAGLVVDTRLLYWGQAKSRIRLKATHQLVDELKTQYNTVLIDLNALKAELLLKASQSEIDELTRRLSETEIRLSGAEALIELKANQSVIDELSQRLTSAEILIDGANAAILLKANQSLVDELTQRLTSAEIAIDGANARIDLMAGQTTLGELEERITAAEIAIDGANAAILLKASAETVDALGSRVSAAEIAIDGMNSQIALKADRIDLEGFVTAEDLETQILTVVNASSIETLVAGFLACGDINAETINCDAVNTGPIDCDSVETETLWATGAHINTLALDGRTVSWASQEVVTSLSGLSKEYADVWYMDSDGSEQYVRVLTNVELRYPGTVTLNYLTG